MKIVVIDDYQDAFRTLRCFGKLDGHEVLVYSDTEKDPVRLAERLKDAEAVILTQARSPMPRALIERLPKLRLLSQTGRSTGHIDIAACTEHGVVISAAGFATPHPTAELTWGLIFAALRHIPYEVRRLREGHWQSTLGVCVKERTLGIYAYGRIGGTRVRRAGKMLGSRGITGAGESGRIRSRAKSKHLLHRMRHPESPRPAQY
jgi:D-3-phosphoglycerate dehydrogenase / 2-oxoglutarate reductase